MVSPLLEGGDELYEGVVPEQALSEVAMEHLLYALVRDPDEAACIRALVFDQNAE
jgi:hypothetical protein